MCLLLTNVQLGSPVIPQRKWKLEEIESIKESVRTTIQTFFENEGKDKTLKYLLNEIYRLSALPDVTSAQQLLITILNTLSFHSKLGGLNQNKLTQLEGLAYGILQSHGISPVKSKLAKLYGELHLIKSHIAFKKGEIWQSAWEQQVALQMAGKQASDTEGYQLISLGLRCNSLGHCYLSESYFVEAETFPL